MTTFLRVLAIALFAVSFTAFADNRGRGHDNDRRHGHDDHHSKALQKRLIALEALVKALQAENAAQTQRIAALEAGGGGGSQNPVFQVLSRDATGNLVVTGADLIVSGGNLHVRNGMGSTETINGKGNLIVGYDENGGIIGAGGINAPDEKTGSHNLVVGMWHSYTSAGGTVLGRDNVITAPAAVVSGGSFNTAKGLTSAVHGGTHNIADGRATSISGGLGNETFFNLSWIGGGGGNVTGDREIAQTPGDEFLIAISGGTGNRAIGRGASVCGGHLNLAEGNFSTVSGGVENRAFGEFSSVSGGRGNSADGRFSSVGGGLNRRVFGEHDWAAGALFQDF